METASDDALRFREASALLASVRDVVDERAEGRSPPRWCVARGWAPFLAALTDDELLAAEREGLAAEGALLARAPDDLRALAANVERAVALPGPRASVAEDVASRRASPRKRLQVAAFAELIAELAGGAARIVDLGAGHGHLTRHLAAALGITAEGWERDPARVAVATALTRTEGARFVTLDVRARAADLRPTDVVVGLHACGELGDLAVRAASEAGAAVALIGCCLQKREGARAPLVPLPGAASDALVLGRGVLGLGNARDGDEGVEENLAARAASRTARLALRRLLERGGHAIAPGEEMRGQNRRRASGDFAELVARAFRLRALTPPSAGEIATARDEAEVERALERRFALPRTMLARLVEVWVARDRAALLAARGYEVDLTLAFGREVSPRNVALLGRRG